MIQQKKRSRPLIIRLVLVLLLGVYSISPAVRSLHAQDAAVKDIIVNNSTSSLLLYFTVVNAFTSEMETGIQNGIPATFTFFVMLSRIRRGWIDQDIVTHTLSRTLTYDNLKEEYQVHFSEGVNRTVTVKTLAEAKTMMVELNGFEVTSMDRLTPGQRYTVEVKASLAKNTLPLYVHYFIPFWSLWDFETDWFDVEFAY